jgi:hypothetical protein
MLLVLTFVEIGADPRAAVADLGLMPLHLACMGCVEDIEQYNKLVEAAGSLCDLQVCGSGCAGVQVCGNCLWRKT